MTSLHLSPVHDGDTSSPTIRPLLRWALIAWVFLTFLHAVAAWR